MIGWNDKLRQRDRLEKYRRIRLQTKLQKAGSINRIGELTGKVWGWNKRFGKVAQLRSTRKVK